MAKRKAKKVAKRRSSKRKRGTVKITKLPKEALTLMVILRAKEGQHLLLEAELRGHGVPEPLVQTTGGHAFAFRPREIIRVQLLD